MKIISGTTRSEDDMSFDIGTSPTSRRWLRRLGWLGILLAAPFFIWFPLSFLTSLPSMIDVFGIPGLRIPASFTVAGLLLAAIGFHRY